MGWGGVVAMGSEGWIKVRWVWMGGIDHRRRERTIMDGEDT